MWSEKKRFEICTYRVMFGWRIRLQEPKTHAVLTDYCCGADLAWQLLVLHAVRAITEDYPEDIAVIELERIFPFQYVKPMWNDPKCWAKLLDLASHSQSVQAMHDEIDKASKAGIVVAT